MDGGKADVDFVKDEAKRKSNDSPCSVQEETNPKKRIKFDPEELSRLQRLVKKYPQIKRKEHDKKNEQMKKEAWEALCQQYNNPPRSSSKKIIYRNVGQLKNAWKRLKKKWKSEQAEMRRNKLKTGGGSPSPTLTEENSEIHDQVPLDDIPDGEDSDNDGDLTISK